MTVLSADDIIIAPRVDPDRAIPEGAQAPYQPGSLVEVLFHPIASTEGMWTPAVVVGIEKPDYSRRFRVTVAIGEGINGFFRNDRVYCWEDGTGEEIRPLTPYPG